METPDRKADSYEARQFLFHVFHRLVKGHRQPISLLQVTRPVQGKQSQN